MKAPNKSSSGSQTPNGPQQQASAANALRLAHTDLHRALSLLDNSGNIQQAKQLAANAISKAANAIAVL